MVPRERLTSEQLTKLFKNNFDLVAQAIRLGRYWIKSGREYSLEELLEEVRKDPSGKKLEAMNDIDKAEDQGGAP